MKKYDELLFYLLQGYHIHCIHVTLFVVRVSHIVVSSAASKFMFESSVVCFQEFLDSCRSLNDALKLKGEYQDHPKSHSCSNSKGPAATVTVEVDLQTEYAYIHRVHPISRPVARSDCPLRDLVCKIQKKS